MPRNITVTLQDGSTHTYQNAPDDVTPDQVSARAQSEFGQGVAHLDGGRSATPAAARPEPSFMQRINSSTAGRFIHGALDPIVGALQMSANVGGINPVADIATDSTGEAFSAPMQAAGGKAFNGIVANREKSYQADRAATGHTGLDLARIAGNIASPINFALPGAGQGASLGARVANGVGTGGLLSALQPVTDGGGFASEKGKQIALGAAAGGALPIVGAAARSTGRGAGTALSHVLGGTTGGGADAVRIGFESGRAGGDAGEAFAQSMRGQTPWENVVAEARGALANMRAQRGAAYREGMAEVSRDATVLDFAPIDRALERTRTINSFRGQDLSPNTTNVRQEIDDAIAQWRQLPPQEYHTPEGFDALKQRIGDIREAQPFHSPQRAIADTTYNAIRQTIAEQAPTYNRVMQDYAHASEELTNLQRELSLGPRGNPATALRKLQSVMRNNANTGWGARVAMANRLTEAGADTLTPALAGQSMNAVLPRGLARVIDAGLAGAGGLTNPATLAALPLASPRAVGELAYGAGRAVRGATALGNLPVIQGLPRLSAGSLGVGLPQLLANPAVYGAQ